MTPLRRAVAVGAVLAAAALPAAAPPPVELPRLEPRRPSEALASFELRPGYRLELAAAEPLVLNPVAMAFDERGRLHVVEMIDYPDPEYRRRKLGRVRRLEDTDGDGTYDRASVLADGLSWPSGIACHDGGVFVAATPDLLYLEDADGDGRAEIREVVFTGFGEGMPEVMPARLFNGFARGPDNRLYGATGGNGGRVRAPGAAGEPLDLAGRDFSFDPRTRELRAESGAAQFGLTFDERGQRYVCSNSRHLIAVMYDERHARRNPGLEMPPPLLDIPVDGPAAEVYRISPDEPWRVWRTRWRLSGLVRGPIEGGGRPSGYFTAACGVTVYCGDAMPELRGHAFVGEPAGNLVHRKLIRSRGAVYEAERAADERRTEFLRSRDTWFRPVNFANGPDGALYVADLYRELVEDPRAIPAEIAGRMDLAAGNAMGRIYRVVPANFTRRPVPRLDECSARELVGLLAHDNAWHHETAARLLYERQDRSVAPDVLALAAKAAAPAARIRALHAAHGLGAIRTAAVERAIADPDPAVREHAARLAEDLLQANRLAPAERPRLTAALRSLAEDPSPRVRYQAAFSLGATGGAETHAALHRIAVQDPADPWISAAVLSALPDSSGAFFARVRTDPTLAGTAVGGEFLRRLISVIGAQGGADDAAEVISYLRELPDMAAAMLGARAFQTGLRRAGRKLADIDPGGGLRPLLDRALSVATDRDAPVALRSAAVRLAAGNGGAESTAALLSLLGPREPQSLQAEAVAALAGAGGREWPQELLRRWPGLSPRVRAEVLGLMLARPERALVLLDAIRTGTVHRAALSMIQQNFLRHHRTAQVQQLARQVLGAGAGGRQQALAEYAAALDLAPDAARGRAVFDRACAACHRFDGRGTELGPNLAGTRAGGKEKLLTNILDPNREIDPAYLLYQLETAEGGTTLGVIAAESPTTISLRQPYGDTTVVPRSSILGLQSVGQSLMPEGLEATVSKQDMADLLEYIVSTDG